MKDKSAVLGGTESSGKSTRSSANVQRAANITGTSSTTSATTKVRKGFTLCLHPHCQTRYPEPDRFYFIYKCDWLSPNEQARYKSEYRKKKQARNSTSTTTTTINAVETVDNRASSNIAVQRPGGSTNCVGGTIYDDNCSFAAILSDGCTLWDTGARFHDGRDDTLIFTTVAEATVRKGDVRERAI